MCTGFVHLYLRNIGRKIDTAFRQIIPCFSGSVSKGNNVIFDSTPVIEVILPATEPDIPADKDNFTKELFASELENMEVLIWNELDADQ